ncbi:MAG: methyl-accepting chemotaxis protein, partial [Agathobacter sp.]
MKQKVRKMSIRWKLILPVGVVIFIVCTLLSLFSAKNVEAQMLFMAKKQAQSVAEMTAISMDASKLASIKPGDENTEAYLSQKDVMITMQKRSGIKYIYTLYTDGETVYYGIDADTSEYSCPIGLEFEVEYDVLKSAFDGEIYVEPEIGVVAGEALITVYAPIFDENHQVVALLGSDYDATDILAEINDTIYKTVALSAIGIVVSLVLVFLSVQNIMRGLNSVNGKIYDLVNNKGDLTQKLDINSGDELELMAHNINDMLEYIREIMVHIAGNSSQLNGSAKHVASNLAATQMSISDVSATMQEMSAGMEETSAALTEINDSIVDIVEEIQVVNERAEHGRTSSDDIMNKAAAIYQNAIAEQEEAKHLADALAEAVNDKIEKSKAVETISQLTDNIISITSQTNLLSLNASIEAARAGEAGRGFAVVADEIGKLATNSAQAAAQIQVVSAEVIEAVNELAKEAEKMLK